jgi:lipopolysaccharide transport system ATP-binding protein
VYSSEAAIANRLSKAKVAVPRAYWVVTKAMSTVISVEHLCKSYRLGTIGGGSLRHDLNSWWAKVRKRPDPITKIGYENRVSRIGSEFWALRDVSFQVKQGQVLGIIGRNGAGKSTLLKILSRVTGPTSGLIKIKGRIASLLEVGTGFHPELTGRENIFLNGTILGMTKSEIRTKFDAIVAFSEIEEFIDTPVKRYSSGMYVRLAFAVAAHLEPEILIVDEVLAVGDIQFQKKCLGKMGEVSRSGRTVLFVSHNLDAVRNLCHNSIILRDGQLIFDGPVERGLEHYLSANVNVSGDVIFKRPDPRRAPFFRSARIVNHVGVTSSSIDVRREFSVELIYEVPEPTRNVDVAIRIFTSDARPVFTSHASEAVPDLLEQAQHGVRSAMATVPGNFLMPGSYLISIALFEPVPSGSIFDNHQAVLQVSIEDTGTIFTRYNHNHLIGVVMKRLSWECLVND